MEPKELTLDSLHDGAALEMFQAALERILENVRDLNTDHRSKREITLKFSFTTNEARDVCDITITAGTKLAGMKGVESLVFVGKHEGRTVAVEQPRQEEMFPQPGGKMVPFTKED